MLKYFLFFFISPYLCALTTLTVSLSSDNNPGGFGEVGDLRYCLNSMNQTLNTTPDDYAIVFAFPMTIQLNGILPIINNSSNPVNITIGNPGPAITVTIDGNGGAYSGFFIPIGNVVIQNMAFQNLAAKGGDGGDGISGGGGGLGAGGAIFVPQTFLNGSYPSVTVINVTISNCSAIGGNGGNYFSLASTGNEGGGGGGGFSGNGGSITTTGTTGGAGGGGFGGNGGDVTLSFDSLGGGGGGGGSLGSRAILGLLTNLGNGGADQSNGLDGNGYGLSITAGSGGGGNNGGNNAGGGGGGGPQGMAGVFGGGGGGSSGSNGIMPQANIPPLRIRSLDAQSSGGSGGDGGGGGGGAIVTTSPTNEVDGQAGSGGYGGGGGGGAGTGAYDTDYTVKGGSGGLGGGGGGGGPSNGPTALGGIDVGNLGGGAGGAGANTYGAGGGGGGGGSGLGAAIFVDTGLNFTIQAFSGLPTIFNTPNNTTQAGIHGTGGNGALDGLDGTALGNSIFLRTGSSLTFIAQDANDILTLGEQVAFVDDTILGAGGTSVFVRGNGTVIYQGTTDYQGSVTINNANFKVDGQIDEAPIFVCRNSSFSQQRGMLSGAGTLTGSVFANSGTISPDIGETLSLGSLTLNPASGGALGSLVHIEINANGSSLVSVAGAASLAGVLEITLDPNAVPGQYILLTSSGITGAFDSVTFTGPTPNYSLSYLPIGNPTFVQLDFTGYPSTTSPHHGSGGGGLSGYPVTYPIGLPTVVPPSEEMEEPTDASSYEPDEAKAPLAPSSASGCSCSANNGALKDNFLNLVLWFIALFAMRTWPNKQRNISLKN